MDFLRTAQRLLNRVTSAIPPPAALDAEPRKRVLLVHAHPCPDSFSHALAAATERGLVEGGHDVARLDLYRPDRSVGEGLRGLPARAFAPALTRAERDAYYGDTAALVASARKDPVVASAHRALAWCDALVVVYPTWWMNQPAILKGLWDRALVRGFAWHFPGEGEGGSGGGGGGGGGSAAATGLVPMLTNVRALACVSTYGAPQYIVAAAGDNGRRMMSQAIRPLFASDCTLQWLGLYQLDSRTDAERAAFLEHVRETFRQF